MPELKGDLPQREMLIWETTVKARIFVFFNFGGHGSIVMIHILQYAWSVKQIFIEMINWDIPELATKNFSSVELIH